MKIKSVMFLNAVRLPGFRPTASISVDSKNPHNKMDYIHMIKECIIAHKDHKSVCVPLHNVLWFETIGEPAINEFIPRESTHVEEKAEQNPGKPTKTKRKTKKRVAVL